jgi:hypothetical protein
MQEHGNGVVRYMAETENGMLIGHQSLIKVFAVLVLHAVQEHADIFRIFLIDF